LGEFAAGDPAIPSQEQCRAELSALLDHVEKNRGQWAGWSAWGAGVRWPTSYIPAGTGRCRWAGHQYDEGTAPLSALKIFSRTITQPTQRTLFWIKEPKRGRCIFSLQENCMEPREEFLRRREREAQEQAEACEMMGFKDLAEAYRKAARLWYDLAEQQKRTPK
jgi:hypothetical protein